MGFLDGLTTLLGGFSDVKQIDEEGFDFREKRAAEQFKRDQDREDWATKAAAEASLGTDDESALASTIPGDVNRARVMARALGAGKQAKSALQAQKAYTDAALLAQRGDQTAREIGLRGDEAESLARVRADLEAGRQPSERDRFIADQAAKRTGMTIEGMLQRARMGGGRGGGKPQLRLTTDGYKWFYPPSDPGGSGDAGADGGGGASGVVSTGEQGPLGVTAKESNVVGTGALASIAALENLMKSTPGSEKSYCGSASPIRTPTGTAGRRPARLPRCRPGTGSPTAASAADTPRPRRRGGRRGTRRPRRRARRSARSSSD